MVKDGILSFLGWLGVHRRRYSNTIGLLVSEARAATSIQGMKIRSMRTSYHVQKAPKRGIIRVEADHAWFVESAADDTSLIEHLAERRRASK
jgi:hypothetical protein